MTERVYNFSAGPAVLPVPVLEEAQRDLLALPGVGMSVLEISHRSTWFDDILGETEANLRRLLAIPDHYRVLFLQGGAQLQFSMVPMSYLRGRDRAAQYVLTGTWGAKALAEARREGPTEVAWSGKDDGFVRVPAADELRLDPAAPYVHVTSNETIQGVQFSTPPQHERLVCDGSSDFLSRPIRVEDYALLYACAQKNAGPAGLTVVLVADDLLERGAAGLPTMLDYRRQAEGGSRVNTPPVFAVYVLMLITRWLEREVGGLEEMARRNREKAALLYDALDADGGSFYQPHAEATSRSQMNVTFRLPSDDLQQRFLSGAKEHGLWELEGHRSVGGIRASIYNAMPRAGVEALRDFMVELRERHG